MLFELFERHIDRSHDAGSGSHREWARNATPDAFVLNRLLAILRNPVRLEDPAGHGTAAIRHRVKTWERTGSFDMALESAVLEYGQHESYDFRSVLISEVPLSSGKKLLTPLDHHGRPIGEYLIRDADASPQRFLQETLKLVHDGVERVGGRLDETSSVHLPAAWNVTSTAAELRSGSLVQLTTLNERALIAAGYRDWIECNARFLTQYPYTHDLQWLAPFATFAMTVHLAEQIAITRQWGSTPEQLLGNND